MGELLQSVAKIANPIRASSSHTLGHRPKGLALIILKNTVRAKTKKLSPSTEKPTGEQPMDPEEGRSESALIGERGFNDETKSQYILFLPAVPAPYPAPR